MHTAHSPQHTRHIGDLSFSVIIMYEPVISAPQVSKSGLLGPAVLRLARRFAIRIVRSMYTFSLAYGDTDEAMSPAHCFH